VTVRGSPRVGRETRSLAGQVCALILETSDTDVLEECGSIGSMLAGQGLEHAGHSRREAWARPGLAAGRGRWLLDAVARALVVDILARRVFVPDGGLARLALLRLDA
jgi:hypothetical protein